jgi:hypothetical protein
LKIILIRTIIYFRNESIIIIISEIIEIGILKTKFIIIIIMINGYLFLIKNYDPIFISVYIILY